MTVEYGIPVLRARPSMVSGIFSSCKMSKGRKRRENWPSGIGIMEDPTGKSSHTTLSQLVFNLVLNLPEPTDVHSQPNPNSPHKHNEEDEEDFHEDVAIVQAIQDVPQKPYGGE